MWLSMLLSLIPNIVLGVERIHGEAKSGADKKTLALDALKVAVSGATGIAPNELQPAIAAAGGLASSVIDGTVGLFNAIGWPSGTPGNPSNKTVKRFTIPVH